MHSVGTDFAVRSIGPSLVVVCAVLFMDAYCVVRSIGTTTVSVCCVRSGGVHVLLCGPSPCVIWGALHRYNVLRRTLPDFFVFSAGIALLCFSVGTTTVLAFPMRFVDL